MTRLVQLYLRACADELIRRIDGPTAYRNWLWAEMTREEQRQANQWARDIFGDWIEDRA